MHWKYSHNYYSLSLSLSLHLITILFIRQSQANGTNLVLSVSNEGA